MTDAIRNLGKAKEEIKSQNLSGKSNAKAIQNNRDSREKFPNFCETNFINFLIFLICAT